MTEMDYEEMDLTYGHCDTCGYILTSDEDHQEETGHFVALDDYSADATERCRGISVLLPPHTITKIVAVEVDEVNGDLWNVTATVHAQDCSAALDEDDDAPVWLCTFPECIYLTTEPPFCPEHKAYLTTETRLLDALHQIGGYALRKLNEIQDGEEDDPEYGYGQEAREGDVMEWDLWATEQLRDFWFKEQQAINEINRDIGALMRQRSSYERILDTMRAEFARRGEEIVAASIKPEVIEDENEQHYGDCDGLCGEPGGCNHDAKEVRTV